MQHYTKAGLSAPKGSVLPASIPLQGHPINRLTQVRHTINYDKIDSLARKIIATGQLSRGRLVALSATEAKNYLVEINALWGSEHTLSSMKSCTIDDNLYYLFVVFGHRRLLACERALTMVATGESEPGRFDNTYLCDIYFGLSLTEVIVMQIGENTYEKPTVLEEIDALWRLWRYMRRQLETLSVGEFAREIGRRPDRVLEMLRFTRLPEKIQARIDPFHQKGALPYHMVLQLARLAEAYAQAGKPFSLDQMETTLDILVLRRVKVKDYTKEVTQRIAALQGQQFDLFGASDARVLPLRRRVVAEHVIRAVLSDLEYLELIHRLVEEGRLGSDHPLGARTDLYGELSPFSPARLTLRIVRLLESVAPALAKQVRGEGRPMGGLETAVDRLLPVGIAFEEILAAPAT